MKRRWYIEGCFMSALALAMAMLLLVADCGSVVYAVMACVFSFVAGAYVATMIDASDIDTTLIER